jgi:hypothetical protein
MDDNGELDENDGWNNWMGKLDEKWNIDEKLGSMFKA